MRTGYSDRPPRPKCFCGCGQYVEWHGKGSDKHWNKYIYHHRAVGVHFLTEEQKRKVGDALRGRKRSPEAIRRSSEGLKGHVHSEETRKKMSQAHLGHPTSEKTRKKIGDAHRGMKHSLKTKQTLAKKVKKLWEDEQYRENMSSSHQEYAKDPEERKRLSSIAKKAWDDPKFREALSGKNASNWMGGTSFEPYAPEFNMALKNQIRLRDSHTCQNPNCPQTSKDTRQPVHHIDYDKKNPDPQNLITLCPSCHMQTSASSVEGRERWKRFYQELMFRRGVA